MKVVISFHHSPNLASAPASCMWYPLREIWDMRDIRWHGRLWDRWHGETDMRWRDIRWDRNEMVDLPNWDWVEFWHKGGGISHYVTIDEMVDGRWERCLMVRW